MDTIKKVAKNTGAILVGNILSKLLEFIVLVFMARYLGVTNYGIYSFVFAYMFFFNILPTLGINKIIVREISRNNSMAKKIIGNALTIRLLLSLLAIILSIIIINILNYPYDTKLLVYIVSVTLLLSSLGRTYMSIFQANLKMKYSVFANLIEKIFLVILILTIIFFKGNLIHIIIATIISNFIGFFISFIYSRRFIKPNFEFDIFCVKKILRFSMPIALSFVFISIYHKIDVIMLSYMKTNEDIGYYSAAYRLTDSLNIIPTAFMMSVFPLMSMYFKNSRDSLESSYERSFRLLLMISLPIAVITTVFSKYIIYLIYGNEFLPSAYALSILVWSVVLSFINIVFGNVIVSMDKQLVTAYVACIMAILNIILNYLLIPQYSYIGASIATVLVEALGAIMYYYYIYSTLIKKSFNVMIVKLVSLNLCIYLFLAILKGEIPNLALVSTLYLWILLLVLLSVVVYFFLLIISNSITKEELSILKSIIGW